MEMAKARPYLIVVILQLLYAGMNILSKLALGDGMSTYVFTNYRHLIAFIVIAPFAAYYERYLIKL
jgi:drug/metabolite transporter (DMT)-like permease